MSWTSYDDTRDDGPRGWPGLAAAEPDAPAPLLPERLLLDLDTPLESFLLAVAILGGIAALFTGIISLSLPEAAPWLGASLAVGVAGLYLRNQVDNYYILDRPSRKLLFRRKIFGREWELPVLPFQDLFAVSLDARYLQTKHSSWWEYALVLVARNGRLVRVGDHLKHPEGYLRAVEAGKGAAETLELPFIEGGQEKILRVSRGPGGEPVLEFRDRFPTELVLVALFIAGFLLLTMWGVIH